MKRQQIRIEAKVNGRSEVKESVNRLKQQPTTASQAAVESQGIKSPEPKRRNEKEEERRREREAKKEASVFDPKEQR